MIGVATRPIGRKIGDLQARWMKGVMKWDTCGMVFICGQAVTNFPILERQVIAGIGGRRKRRTKRSKGLAVNRQA
jgi:hypothetical protein